MLDYRNICIIAYITMGNPKQAEIAIVVSPW